MGYEQFYNRFIKRWIGFIIALLLLLLIWPIYLIIGILIVVNDGFPIFYRPYRGGYNKRNFRIIKFRTMIKNADQIGGGTTALNDSRITKSGVFLRKTKLDEIPQLFNILKGEMAFIGPRPELLKYTEQYTEEEQVILKVRPGITDYSSLEFISLDEIVGEQDVDEIYERMVLKKKNQLRIKYANEVSFLVDVTLFVKTIVKVIQKFTKTIIGGNK